MFTFFVLLPAMKFTIVRMCRVPYDWELRCRADATAKRLGPEHDKALLALSRLAWVLEARGAFAEAEPLRRRVLDSCERRLGPEHRVTLEAVHNLASVLLSLGNLSEAEALHRRCLAAHEVKAS
eukprot:s5643_g1.t1